MYYFSLNVWLIIVTNTLHLQLFNPLICASSVGKSIWDKAPQIQRTALHPPTLEPRFLNKRLFEEIRYLRYSYKTNGVHIFCIRTHLLRTQRLATNKIKNMVRTKRLQINRLLRTFIALYFLDFIKVYFIPTTFSTHKNLYLERSCFSFIKPQI